MGVNEWIHDLVFNQRSDAVFAKQIECVSAPIPTAVGEIKYKGRYLSALVMIRFEIELGTIETP